MNLIPQLFAAAEIAEKSRFNTTINVTTEGIVVEVINGDLAYRTVCAFRDVDAGELPRAVEHAIMVMQRDIDTIIHSTTGVWPEKPTSYLP